MGLYDKWCEVERTDEEGKHFWLYVEKPGGRDAINDDLVNTIRSHYDRLEDIADSVDDLGYEMASEVLREMMPIESIGRSGDFGEILATELVEENTSFRVPIRRLRYRDHREMPMRGDDFIGVEHDARSGKLWLMKGEAKSRKRHGKEPVDEARESLDENHGRCTPVSLHFVAKCLLYSGNDADKELGRRLRNLNGDKSLGAFGGDRRRLSRTPPAWTAEAGTPRVCWDRAKGLYSCGRRRGWEACRK